MRKRIWIYIVLSELILIVIGGYKLFNRQYVLGKATYSDIAKYAELRRPVDGLKFFYEPRANSNATSSGFLSKYKSVYTINADALNERKNYSISSWSTTYRIVTIGDSFTFGLNVDTKDNWTELLEDMLNEKMKCTNIKRFEVINLGVWGYDFQYTVERYKLRGQKYNPNLVTWFLVDMLRMNEQLRGKMFEYKEKESKVTKKENSKIVNGYEPYLKARDEIVAEMGVEKILNFQKEQFYKFKEYYKGPLVVIPNPAMLEQHKKKLEEFTSDGKNSFYFDGLNDFDGSKDTFQGDGHPNQLGHKIIANDIFNYLKSSELIPCN